MNSTARQPMTDLNRALGCANDAEAFRSLLRAAQGGCLRAQSLVGLAYHTGRGVALDFEQAAGWYRKAAAGGDSCAMANLGVMSFLGQGTVADNVDAYTWLRSAVGLGHEQLRPALDLLERRLTGNSREYDGRIACLVSPQTPEVRPCPRAVCDPCLCEPV
jgi:TPR repeat protein